MESEVKEYILLDKDLVEAQSVFLKERMDRATKGKNIEYRFYLEFFFTELKLWRDSVEVLKIKASPKKLYEWKLEQESLTLKNGKTEKPAP